jgi:signal transduction histidine kinase
MASRIHGELGQILTVLKTDLSLLSQKVSTDQKEHHALIKEIKKTIDQTIQTVQKISTELKPRLIDEVGLVEAVRWQAKEFQKHTGIKCELSLSEKDMNPDKRTSIVLFRILQEALTNVARHAEATRVTVNLSAKPNALSLKIKDNGKGISEDRLSSLTSFGILGIKESVLSLAGKVEIKGIPDKGTTVKLSLPLKNRIGDG